MPDIILNIIGLLYCLAIFLAIIICSIIIFVFLYKKYTCQHNWEIISKGDINLLNDLKGKFFIKKCSKCQKIKKEEIRFG